MVLFNRPPDNLEKLFLAALDKKVGGEIVKPLYAHFGIDLYLILSILNGQYKHFPSLKVLRSLLLQCDIFNRVETKKASNDGDSDRALNETAYELGISVKKAQQLYDRFVNHMSD